MANYKMEIKDGILSKTLIFMGHEFTEKWEERNTLCSNPIEEQIAKTLDDVSDELIELTLCATCSNDEDEIMDAIYALTVYEKSQGELS